MIDHAATPLRPALPSVNQILPSIRNLNSFKQGNPFASLTTDRAWLINREKIISTLFVELRIGRGAPCGAEFPGGLGSRKTDSALKERRNMSLEAARRDMYRLFYQDPMTTTEDISG